MDKTVEWMAQRVGGGSDLVIGFLPHMPVRMKIIAAHHEAIGIGFDEVPLLDDEGNPTGQTKTETVYRHDPVGEDLVAIAYAALGVCWTQPPLPDAPSFRECGRDVIEYGERIQTVIMENGYLTDGLIEASKPVIEKMQRTVAIATGLIKETAEDFDTAQE